MTDSVRAQAANSTSPTATQAVRSVVAKAPTKTAQKAVASKAATPRSKSAKSPSPPAGKAPSATPTSKAKAAAKPAVKAAKSAKSDKAEKAKKPKMVRDSFTMPKTEYVVLDALKARATQLKMSAKKTELIRAGIKALAAMSDTAFKAAVSNVPNLKTGRPAKV